MEMSAPRVPQRCLQLLIILVSIGFFSEGSASAQDSLPGDAPYPVAVYYFWGDGCPYCDVQREFLAELKRHYPAIELHDFEVWYDADNLELFRAMAEAFGFEARGVPATFIADSYWVGFNEAIAWEIAGRVDYCGEHGCADAAARLEGEFELEPMPPDDPTTVLTLPLLGSIDLAGRNLAVTTTLIAFVDGFNPCSLWVLSMLLAMVIYSGSRKKVLLVGLTFLAITAAAYGLFIAGLFNVLSYVGYLVWIQVGVALLALSFALINLKDYFWYRQGLSLTIPDRFKPKIYRDIRGVMASGKSPLAIMGATAMMALGITLVELPCTAGFPVIWSGLLAQQSGSFNFALLLALYIVVYLSIELIVFGVAVVTLKGGRLEEQQGRVIKLFGGMIMLALALVLLVAPELMNSLSASLLVFGMALAVSLLVLVVHRLLLPALGLRIGSEPRAAGRRKA